MEKFNNFMNSEVVTKIDIFKILLFTLILYLLLAYIIANIYFLISGDGFITPKKAILGLKEFLMFW